MTKKHVKTIVHQVTQKLVPGLIDAPFASDKTIALVDELNTIRDQMSELTARKEEINARLLKRMRTEGAEDDKGKVRAQTEDSTLVIVENAHRHIDGKKLIALGVKASVITKATKVTPYAYVSVSKKKAVDTAGGE